LKGRGIKRWLLWVLAAMILLSGCSSVLLESKDQNGQVDRIMVDTGPSWANYDQRPRDPYVDANKHGLGDMSIMLKSVKTF